MTQTKYSISTYNGEFFDFAKPEDYNFDIETIAHALSHICRYGGHSNWFYSVAEHSVYVSRVVPPELALCGLLHDASEAFVGDMPSPLKALCPEYREIEERVQAALAAHYDLPYPFPSEIHLADKALYKSEREQITNVADNVWHTDIKPASVRIACLSSKKAKNLFLSRFEELYNERYPGLRPEGTTQSKAA